VLKVKVQPNTAIATLRGGATCKREAQDGESWRARVGRSEAQPVFFSFKNIICFCTSLKKMPWKNNVKNENKNAARGTMAEQVGASSFLSHQTQCLSARCNQKDSNLNHPRTRAESSSISTRRRQFFCEKYENCRFSRFSGLNSRVLNPTRQPKSAILNPEMRFCGLRVG
jgi:hypothetical protein